MDNHNLSNYLPEETFEIVFKARTIILLLDWTYGLDLINPPLGVSGLSHPSECFIFEGCQAWL